YLVVIARKEAAFCHSKWSKRTTSDVIHLFQEDDAILTAKYPKRLQYLISTKILGVGLDLFKANRVVQWDPEWSVKVLHQNRGRVWRQGQDKVANSYTMWAENSTAEILLLDTCARKTWLDEMTKRGESTNDFLTEAADGSGDTQADAANENEDTEEESEVDEITGTQASLENASFGEVPT
ncbi:MAG: hypothetical protein Q9180_008732, partial [Flavoplaca navasiana]